MESPGRIRISFNGADAAERFAEAGLRHTQRTPPTPEAITHVLGMQTGRLFALMGFAGEPPVSVALQILGQYDDRLAIRNRLEGPQFEGYYYVAAEPPPSLSVHGDYLFDLIRVDADGPD